jgi:AcrR family transcriptional regulator
VAAATSASAPPGPRREQMLRAAAELIGERGFSETRIADVARRAGASPALVIYYFATKDQLLTEALRFSEEAFYSTVTAGLESLRTARERLELLVRTTCVPRGEAGVPGGWGLWFDLWAQAFRHPEIAKDRIELDQRWRDTIAQVVRNGQARGEIGDVDADAFAITFSALIDGLSIRVALQDLVVDPERAFAIAMAFAARELDVAWRPRRVVQQALPSGRSRRR